MYFYLVHKCIAVVCAWGLTLNFNYKYSKEYSIEADTLSGRYYWTNVFFFDSDYENPFDDPSVEALTTATAFSVGVAVRQERVRVERVAGAGTFAEERRIDLNGALGGFGRSLLHNAVRVSAGDKYTGWWWKAFRCCLRPSDLNGRMLSDFILTHFQENVVDLLATVPLTNYKRVPVGTIRIHPDVRSWQWRHGTKRRSRTVLGAAI